MLQAQTVALPRTALSPLPQIVLTECSSVPPSASEGSVRDQTQGPSPVSQTPVETGPQMVSQTQPSQDPMGQPQKAAPVREHKIQESFEEVGEKREELSLVLTELDVRAMSPSEALDLGRSAGAPLRSEEHTSELQSR